MQPAAPRPLTWKKKLVFALVTVVGLAALLETAARLVEWWLPPQPVDWGLGFDPSSRLFVPSPANPALLVTSEAKRTVFRTQEFAAHKPPGTLRLVALGESSVNYLDPELRVLEGQLQEGLRPRYDRVEVINAGGLSYGSHRLVPLAVELLEYEPDVFLVYVAHNEFEEVEQFQLAARDSLALQQAASHSALVRLVRDRVTAAQVARLRREHNQRVLAEGVPNFARAWRYPFTQKDVDERMQAFRENLSFIVTACRDRGVLVVLGTVPSNLVRPYLPEKAWHEYQPVWALLERQEYEQAAALGRRILAETPGRHQSSDLENDILRTLARERDVPLADVEAAICQAEPHGVPGETLFKDHCHLNDRGNELLRQTYARVLLDVLR
jgi:lysophospholipase L1-like esterase